MSGASALFFGPRNAADREGLLTPLLPKHFPAHIVAYANRESPMRGALGKDVIERPSGIWFWNAAQRMR
jgi:hypothetical protein